MLRRIILSVAILPSALLITACEPADNEPGPGGVSVGEARALDEAAEIIEARRFPLPGEIADAEKQTQNGQSNGASEGEGGGESHANASDNAAPPAAPANQDKSE